MASIRIRKFAGIAPEIASRLLGKNGAQVAHNCLLGDGALRPSAMWIKIAAPGGPSMYFDTRSNSVRSDNIALDTKNITLPAQQLICLDNNGIRRVIKGTEVRGSGIGTPEIFTSSVSYARGFFSKKPVNRLYAVTGITETLNGIEEGPITLLPNQSPNSVIYEGDIVNIQVSLYANERTGYRLYRSISGLDTGKDVTNALDTEWYLVAQFDNTDFIQYIDGGSATTDLLDLYLAGRFYELQDRDWKYLAQTDGGWTVVANYDGDIAACERYLTHAWPTENYYKVEERITDIVGNDDNVYIGTENVPYIASFAQGEGTGLQVGIKPYPEGYRCIPNTMCKTPWGAIYASSNGVVTLSKEDMKVVTAGIANNVTSLYKTTYTKDGTIVSINLQFRDTLCAAYHLGYFYGFASKAFDIYDGVSYGYRFNTNNNLDGAKPADTLTTFDAPPAPVTNFLSCSKGLYVYAGERYLIPLPTDETDTYTRAKKMCYTWKSSIQVMDTRSVFGAAKVVRDCKGFVKLKIFADGCCVYNEDVNCSKPFNLPPNIVGTEFQIQLDGTATVHEVHIASSMQELARSE